MELSFTKHSIHKTGARARAACFFRCRAASSCSSSTPGALISMSHDLRYMSNTQGGASGAQVLGGRRLFSDQSREGVSLPNFSKRRAVRVGVAFHRTPVTSRAKKARPLGSLPRGYVSARRRVPRAQIGKREREYSDSFTRVRRGRRRPNSRVLDALSIFTERPFSSPCVYFLFSLRFLLKLVFRYMLVYVAPTHISECRLAPAISVLHQSLPPHARSSTMAIFIASTALA